MNVLQFPVKAETKYFSSFEPLPANYDTHHVHTAGIVPAPVFLWALRNTLCLPPTSSASDSSQSSSPLLVFLVDFLLFYSQ